MRRASEKVKKRMKMADLKAFVETKLLSKSEKTLEKIGRDEPKVLYGQVLPNIVYIMSIVLYVYMCTLLIIWYTPQSFSMLTLLSNIPFYGGEKYYNMRCLILKPRTSVEVLFIGYSSPKHFTLEDLRCFGFPLH
jgi:hypothetical protein